MEKMKEIDKYRYARIALIIGLVGLIIALGLIVALTPFFSLVAALSLAEGAYYLFLCGGLLSFAASICNQLISAKFNGLPWNAPNKLSKNLAVVGLCFTVLHFISYFFNSAAFAFLWGAAVASDFLLLPMLLLTVFVIALVLLHNINIQLSVEVVERLPETKKEEGKVIVPNKIVPNKNAGAKKYSEPIMSLDYQLPPYHHKKKVYHSFKRDKRVFVVLGSPRSTYKNGPPSGDLNVMVLKEEEKTNKLFFSTDKTIAFPSSIQNGYYKPVPINRRPLVILGQYVFLLAYKAVSGVCQRSLLLYVLDITEEKLNWKHTKEYPANESPTLLSYYDQAATDYANYGNHISSLVDVSAFVDENRYVFSWPYYSPNTRGFYIKVIDIHYDNEKKKTVVCPENRTLNYRGLPQSFRNEEKKYFFLSREQKEVLFFSERLEEMLLFEVNENKEFVITGHIKEMFTNKKNNEYWNSIKGQILKGRNETGLLHVDRVEKNVFNGYIMVGFSIVISNKKTYKRKCVGPVWQSLSASYKSNGRITLVPKKPAFFMGRDKKDKEDNYFIFDEGNSRKACLEITPYRQVYYTDFVQPSCRISGGRLMVEHNVLYAFGRAKKMLIAGYLRTVLFKQGLEDLEGIICGFYNEKGLLETILSKRYAFSSGSLMPRSQLSLEASKEQSDDKEEEPMPQRSINYDGV